MHSGVEKGCSCVMFLHRLWLLLLFRLPQSRVSILHPPAFFSLASFVWRLHKRPPYLSHLCRPLARLWVFFFFLSHFSVLLSSHLITPSSTLFHGSFAFSQGVFILLQHTLCSLFFQTHFICIHLSPSLSFLPFFLSHLCQVCTDPPSSFQSFFFFPLFCGQFSV